MIELLLTNLNIVLKLNNYNRSIVDKFTYFIKVELLSQNYDLQI
jgi:hypothetical protein